MSEFTLWLWAAPKPLLERVLEDLLVPASVKEQVKQELARRNAWRQPCSS